MNLRHQGEKLGSRGCVGHRPPAGFSERKGEFWTNGPQSRNYNLYVAGLRNPLRSVDAGWNMPENIDMDSGNNEAMVFVTGATGHIGREVCRLLPEARWQILAVDLDQDITPDVRACDLRSKSQISALFQDH
jgi:hypothetical protein